MARCGYLTLRLLCLRQSCGTAPEPELVVLWSSPKALLWGLKEGALNLDILRDNPSLLHFPTSALWLAPSSSSASRCHSYPLGWLLSSVSLSSGTPTCPGRHIGSEPASLHSFHLAVMQSDPGVKQPPEWAHQFSQGLLAGQNIMGLAP